MNKKHKEYDDFMEPYGEASTLLMFCVVFSISALILAYEYYHDPHPITVFGFVATSAMACAFLIAAAIMSFKNYQFNKKK